MKKLAIIFILFTFCCYSQFIRPNYASDDERKLLEAWKNGDSIPFSMVRSILVAEGTTDPGELETADAKVERMLKGIDASVRRRKGAIDKAKIVFEYLHDEYFKTYHSYALISGIFDKGYFSSVNAAALFMDACRRYEIPVSLHQTSAHIYLCVVDGRDTVRIEIGDPDGFDSIVEKHRLLDVLRTMFSKGSSYISSGDEAKYFREYLLNRQCGPYSLLAYRYFLDASAYLQTQETQKAIDAIEKALYIEPHHPLYLDLHASTFFSFATLAKGDKLRYFLIFERYLQVHRDDADFIEMNIAALENYCIYFREQRDYQRCLQMLSFLSGGSFDDADIKQMLSDQTVKTHYYWAYNHFETGDYKLAFEKMKDVLRLDSASQRYIETSLKFAARYSSWLIEKGKSKEAFVILDSVIVRYFIYPFIKETYIKSSMNLVHGENLLRDKPSRAVEVLLNAYRYDPENKPLTNLIASAYHNYAKEKMKVMNYKVAREIVMKGLQYSPNDTYLKADLKYLDSGKK